MIGKLVDRACGERHGRNFFRTGVFRPFSRPGRQILYGGRACYPRAMSENLHIERCISLDQPGWLEFRVALWPDATADEHRAYMATLLAQPERYLQLVAYDQAR